MRVSLVRNVGLHITALAVLALGACNDNPVDFDVKDTVGIFSNPSSMVVAAGRTAQIASRTVNEGNEPTFDDISAAVDPACGPGAITVEVDPEWLPDIQPPGRFVVTGGTTLGPTCVVLTSGSHTFQVDVVVVTNAIEITSPPPDSIYRAGDTGQVLARLIDADGNAIEPYDPADAAFESTDEDVAAFTDDIGNFSVETAGAATLSVTWVGQEANGTAGLGVTRTDQVTIEVIATLPDTAYFTAGDDLGVMLVDTVKNFDVFVSDSLGNRNTLPDEIIAVTAQSSDVNVATVVPRIATDDAAFGEGDVPVVEVTTLAAGSVVISGTVETSVGDFPFSGTLLVPNPQVTSVAPASGAYAETVVITGSDFADIAKVYVGGYLLGNYTIDSPTQITAQMPTYSVDPGPLDVVVSVGGVESPTGPTWTQTTAFSEGSTEDNSVFISGNDAPISVPAFIAGTMVGEPVDPLYGTQTDWFFITISGSGERTIDITATPVGEEDMAIDVIDGGLNYFWCELDSTGSGSPDGGECDLPGEGEPLDDGGTLSVGTWWVIPWEWNGNDALYELEIVMVDE